MQRYRVVIGFRFRFDPRQLDEMTCQEFDEFAAACDATEREEAKQRREAERAGGATRRPGRR